MTGYCEKTKYQISAKAKLTLCQNYRLDFAYQGLNRHFSLRMDYTKNTFRKMLSALQASDAKNGEISGCQRYSNSSLQNNRLTSNYQSFFR